MMVKNAKQGEVTIETILYIIMAGNKKLHDCIANATDALFFFSLFF